MRCRTLRCVGFVAVVALSIANIFMPRWIKSHEQKMVESLVHRANRICRDQTTVRSFRLHTAWEHYRFVDFYRGNLVNRTSEDWKSFVTGYPGSLMEAYHQTALAEGKFTRNFELLQHVVRQRVESTTMDDQLPAIDTLVIHLRLGDVVDWAVESVTDLLLSQHYFYRKTLRPGNGSACKGNCEDPWVTPRNPEFIAAWNAYVRPLSYYQNILGKLDGNFTEVVLMGAAHVGRQPLAEPTKSCVYTHALRLFFEREMGTTVTLRLGKPPDEDFVYASSAKMFVQAGGSFSNLLGDLVTAFGGEVLPRALS